MSRKTPTKYVTYLAVLALASAFVAAGCGDDDDGGPAQAPDEVADVGSIEPYPEIETADPDERYEIIVLMAHRLEPFSLSESQGAMEMADELGVDVTVQDVGGYQFINKQITQIEAAIQQRPDALIVFSTEPEAVVPALQRAQNADIPVVGWTQEPALDDMAFVLSSRYDEDAEKMATALFDRMGGAGEVFKVLGAPGSGYFNSIEEGFARALAEYPDIEVVGEETIPDFDPAKVQSQVEDALVSNPELGGVFTMTSQMAVGASNAIAAADRLDQTFTVGEIVAGCDVIEALETGRLTILLGAPGYYLGRRVIADTVRYLNGEDVPQETIIVGNVYTADNIDEAGAPLEDEIAPEFTEDC